MRASRKTTQQTHFNIRKAHTERARFQYMDICTDPNQTLRVRQREICLISPMQYDSLRIRVSWVEDICVCTSGQQPKVTASEQIHSGF